MNLLHLLSPPSEMVGDRIESIEIIPAEFGRTNDSYVCIVGESSRRYMLGITRSGDRLYSGSQVFAPKPRLEDMKKAPRFFTDEMVALRAAEDQRAERDRQLEAERRKREEYERLRKEFGVDG